MYNSINNFPNTHMDYVDQKTREKLFVLATLWTTFAGAFLLVIAANYR